MRIRRLLVCVITAPLAALLCLAGSACDAQSESAPAEQASAPEPEPILCRAELRSFIVAGKGRHLYLLIDCPPGFDDFDGRVEYTTAAMRRDYTAPEDRSGAARVAKMTAGRPLMPIIENAQDRFEAEFEITLEQAICLQQDRVFGARYALLGTNSSSGLRRTLELCDCEMPSRIVGSGGFFGEYPGIDEDPGPVLDRERWPVYGIEGEPEITAPENDFSPSEPAS